MLLLMSMFIAEGYCWSRTSERQVLRIRYKYLEAILRQEVGFFDSQEATTSEIISSISKDTALIQEVLSEKVLLVCMSYDAAIYYAILREIFSHIVLNDLIFKLVNSVMN